MSRQKPENHENIDETILASKRGDKEAIIKLISSNSININARDNNGCTALMWASYNGHKEIVELLIKHPNIDINMFDDKHVTALMRASQKGHKEIVEILLKIPNIDVYVKTAKDNSAFKLALQNDHAEIAELLLNYSFKKEINSSAEVIFRGVNAGTSVNPKSVAKFTFLNLGNDKE